MVSYAYGGNPGGPPTLDAWGVWENHYSAPGPASVFAKPIPVHALTAGAEQAREAVRRAARAKLSVRSLVTEHGNPHVEPYLVPEYRTTKKGKKKATGRMIPGGRPAAATKLAALAESKGFRVNVFETPERTVVEGFMDPHAFRASWLRGRAEPGAMWHERTARYAMVDDARPVGVDKVARVGLKGKRAAGVDRTHLTIVASPLGVVVGVTEVTRRVSEL